MDLDKQTGELDSIVNFKKAIERELEITEGRLATYAANNGKLQKQVSEDIESKTVSKSKSKIKSARVQNADYSNTFSLSFVNMDYISRQPN